MAHQLDYANQIIIFAVFAMSLNILMGYAGQASMAHAAFGAVGGYTAGLFSIHEGLPFLACLALGIAFGTVAGSVVSLPALRLAGDYLVLLTLAVAYIVASLVNAIHGLGGQYGLQGLKAIRIGGWIMHKPPQIFPLFLVVGLLVLAFCWRLGESPYGRVLKGLREDEMATRALGKNTVWFKTATFGLTAGVAGLAGAMLIYYYQIVSPAQFTLTQSINIIAMVILGGSGNLIGSVLGAIVVIGSTPVLEDLVKLNPDRASFVQLIIFGAVLVVLMRFRPGGLLPEGMWAEHTTRRNSTSARVPADTAQASAADVRADVPEGFGYRPAGIPSPGAGLMTLASGSAASMLVDDTNERPALIVRQLRKHFGGILAVDGVDLDIPRHQVTALIGPNGAGKSTLFGLMCGFIRPDAGSLILGERRLDGLRPDQVARLGMVRSFQDVRLFSMLTVLDNVMLGVPGQSGERFLNLFLRPRRVATDERQSRASAMRYLELLGIAKRAHARAGDLSYGEQKLVAIARVLATEAEVLLLDEPTSGIDQEWVSRVAEAIRTLPALGRTICIVEHNLSFLNQLGAPCRFMEMGRVTSSGTLNDLMSDERLRTAYFGV